MTSNDSSTTSRSGHNNRARYWRSLAELQQSEEFQQYLHREFPVAASEFPEGVSRRRWLQLMSASLGLAGVAGCRYPEEIIAPFVVRPEGRVPGESYSRATNFELAGRVYNLLVSNVDGRPIKIEPNNEHPSGGGTDAYSQASVLGLYDPDRFRGDDDVIIHREPGERPENVSWDRFVTYGSALLRTARENGSGRGFAVLMPPTSSPSVVRMLGQLKEALPEVTFARFDPVGDGVMWQATRQAFGKPARQVLDLEDAEVVVAIQADLLGSDPGFLRNAKGYAAQRDPVQGQGTMSRWYVVEGGYSQTGAAADSRLALRPSQMPAFLAELRRRLDEDQAAGEQEAGQEDTPSYPEVAYDELEPAERLARFLDAVVSDLKRAGDKAVVVVGDHLGPEAVIAGMALNQKLGSLGTLQRFREEVDARFADAVSLPELVGEIEQGRVNSLLVLGGNPVFTAPGDVGLASALERLDHSIYVGEYDDETAAQCHWSLPLAHPLESWGDVISDDGFYGVCQPHILPLLGGRTIPEILALMLEERVTDTQLIVRRTADEVGEAALSNREWRKLLHDGYLEQLTVGDYLSDLQSSGADGSEESPVAATEVDQDDIEVVFIPSEGVYDGRFANNAWLQEMPQSLTKLTWGNAAVMSPATAKALRINHGVMVALRRGDVTIELPVYEMPGCAPGVVTVAYGYGRTHAGMVGGMELKNIELVGVDVAPLRTTDSRLVAYKIEARPRYTEYELPTTQDHWAIDELGREETEQRSFQLVREGTLKLLEKIPEFAEVKGPHVPPVGDYGSPFQEPINRIEEQRPEVPQWGMSIDLSKCIGCNACVVACQSENNVPIVGKEQVINSREMHWLRVDRYFQGDADNADVVQQPVACMHCETAPCEQVCPVAATVHTDDGINAMAYNRCIGTRYCANNCPFKVRRFNYFNYNDEIGVGYGINAYQNHIESANRELQQLVLNPEVTVRGRGVMEKCTYCVQRVEKAKIQARQEGGRPIADGEVVTACQAACPTNAIVFGNVGDADSKVAKLHSDVRSYGMLGQLNVKPRTEYLARVRNPHPMLMTRVQLDDLAELEPPHHGHGHGEDDYGDHGIGSHSDEPAHNGDHSGGHDESKPHAEAAGSDH